MPTENYEVIIARHGSRTGTRSEAYLNYAMYGEPDGSQVTDYYLWVVRNANRTILIDTGYAADAAGRRGRTVLHSPAEIYRRLGIDTAAGWPVVVTHAHWDHIGNLDLFPASPIWISEAEADFWSTTVSRSKLISHFTESAELAQLESLRAEGRVVTFTGETELAPGVVLRHVGGHTPGQSMVSVQTSEGVVLLTSDVVHFVEELNDRKPFVSVTDLPGMYDGFSLVEHLRSTGHADIVVTGHDPSALDIGERLDVDTSIVGRLSVRLSRPS